MSQNIKKIVLAYSGGLDTSVILKWLQDAYQAEVVTFTADLGQGEELEPARRKAEKAGIKDIYIDDLREEFVRDYVYPMVRANAVYEGQYLLGTSMARPVIARAQVKLALELGADALCHGCTGKGNDQVRFEGAFAALAPQLKVIAPWREWQFNSRQSLLNYLAEKKVPTTASATKIYSRDANLWHISHEGGELENPWCEPSEQVWMWTKSPEQAPDHAAYVELSFVKGELTQINGNAIAPVAAIELLNEIGSEHGVGRIDIVENRLVGMKSRGCYETPGGTILMAALKGLEALVYDRTSLKYREEVGLEFAQLVYDGRWFTPLKDALLAAATSLAEQLTGDVVIKLYKGNVTVAKRRSPNSLYSEAFATFEGDEVYNQKDAAGFIRLYSLASRIRALHQQQKD